VVVDGDAQFLFAPEILFGRLYAYVSEKELDLLQFAARQMTQTCARPPQIVRRKFAQLSFGGKLFHNAPDHLLGDTFTPHGADLADATEDPPRGHLSGGGPAIESVLDPIRDWDGSDVAAFSIQIDNDPSFVALLDVRESQLHDLGSSKATSGEHGDDRTVPLAFHRV
jgi:hypothetical protein